MAVDPQAAARQIRHAAVIALAACLALGQVGAQAQKAQLLEFAVTRAYPAGRAFTYAVITGMAGNYAYDALPNALKPADKKAPAPAPTPSLPDLHSMLDKPSCAAPGCLPHAQQLFELDKQWTSRPLTPVIQSPPPPAKCEKGMDGMQALRRAVDFDNGTMAWKRDAAAAETCYYLAALLQIPIAQYNLADMLLGGDDGVPTDQRVGLQWMDEAARNGFVPAQKRLAIGLEARGEAEQAARWYEEAGLSGDAYSQYQMARFRYSGLGGTGRSMMATFRWLDLALGQDFPGSGQSMDDLLAQVREDARDGIPGAMLVLGFAFEVGVPGRIRPDAHQAFEAYRDARRNGSREAEVALKRLCDGSPGACF